MPDVKASDVKRNDDRTRYELSVDDSSPCPNTTASPRRDVYPHRSARGVRRARGRQYACTRGARRCARSGASGHSALPPFIAAFMRRHKAYQDLLSPVSRRQFERDA